MSHREEKKGNRVFALMVGATVAAILAVYGGFYLLLLVVKGR